MSGWNDSSRSNLVRDPGAVASLPPEVQQLIREAREVAHGDGLLTVAVLWERLIWDTEIASERAVFMRWLASQSASDWAIQVEPAARLDRSA
jgi:hypothetical protein